MFPDEYAVVVDTAEDGKISLFAPENKVRVEESLMSVQRLNDGNGSGVLVRLPAQPFEIFISKRKSASREPCKRMILSNLEIQKALDKGRVIITHDPQPRSPKYSNCPYDTTAVDLHLAGALSVPRLGAFNYYLSQGEIATFLARNSEHLEIPATGYVLKPHLFVLGRTQETISLPLIPGQTLAARIEGKSSFARCGLLVHFTAPTVHGGFD